MAIVSITTSLAGQTGGLIGGVVPRQVSIVTTDNLATVTTAGYLTEANLQGYTIFNTDIINMWYGATLGFGTIASPGTFSQFTPSINNGIITLVALVNPGNVLLPVVANHIAVFNGTTGQITGDLSPAINGGNIQAGLSGTAGKFTSFPGTAANGSFVFQAVNNSNNFASVLNNAAVAQATTYTLPDPGAATANIILSTSGSAQTIAGGLTVSTGNVNVSAGNVVAGASGAAGTVTSFPATASKGSLILAAVNNTGNTNTTISNAAMGQASVISIPDPGAATANFVLDAGSQNVQTDHQIFVPASFQNTQFSTGTWTNTRIAQGDYGMVHTAAANSPIVAMDISAELRTTASKGYELTSIGVISKVDTLALTSATPTINQVIYANNVANAVTQLAFTGSLSTATQANPYVDVLTITTPAYQGSNSNLVLEITYVCQATTALTFYGVILNFTRTVI